MRTRIVADIGNSRIKWGRCGSSSIEAQAVVSPEDPETWKRQAEAWNLGPTTWIVGSVQPQIRERFVRWLQDRGDSCVLLDSYRRLPLEVALQSPERVGLDRLFDAIAARSRTPAQHAALIVDAGSAVTVDLVDDGGAFRGGAIFPGLRLMAQALHDHTAQLPLIEATQIQPPPGTSTRTAIETGIVHAVLGGIELLLRKLGKLYPRHIVFVTGGDAPLLAPALHVPHTVWPAMTLEGMRLAVELPDDLP